MDSSRKLSYNQAIRFQSHPFHYRKRLDLWNADQQAAASPIIQFIPSVAKNSLMSIGTCLFVVGGPAESGCKSCFERCIGLRVDVQNIVDLFPCPNATLTPPVPCSDSLQPMSLAELLIALQGIRRRSVLALIASVHYAKRNVFGFTFISIQALFIVGYAIAAQHKNWSARASEGGSVATETAPEEAIPSNLNPSNGLQALFLSLLGQGLMYSYLRKYGFSAIGFSFLIGIVILEWGVLLRYFFEVLPSAL